MRSVFIVGAAGFVGRALARTAARYDAIRTFSLAHSELDLERPETWFHIEGGADCLVHAAGRLDGNREQLFAANADHAADLAECLNAKSVRRLIYLSTGAVYGAVSGITTPATECRPESDYPQSKRAAERAFRDVYKGELRILRLYYPYGPGQAKPRLMPRLLDAVLREEVILCNRDGGPWLNLSHVDDLAGIILNDFILPKENGPAVVNLASDRIMSIAEIAGAMARHVGKPVRLAETGTQPSAPSVPYAPGRWRAFAVADIDPPQTGSLVSR